jgi:hypothetical protein
MTLPKEIIIELTREEPTFEPDSELDLFEAITHNEQRDPDKKKLYCSFSGAKFYCEKNKPLDLESITYHSEKDPESFESLPTTGKAVFGGKEYRFGGGKITPLLPSEDGKSARMTITIGKWENE